MNLLRYLTISAMIFLLTPWPDRAVAEPLPSTDKVRRVEAIILTHNRPTSPTKYRRGLTEFDQAKSLRESPAVEQIWQSKPWRRPQQPKSYVAWLELRALQLSQGSLIGPISWKIPATPQLNYPLLERSLWSPAPDFQLTLSALAQSEEWTVVEADSWFQALSRQARPIKLGQACGNLADYATLTWSRLLLACTLREPLVYGMVSLEDRQFLTASVSVVKHYPNPPSQGPLRSEYLASIGTGFHRLDARRVVSEGVWHYFDSDAIGVLLRVHRLNDES